MRLIECSTRLERRGSNEKGEMQVMVEGEDEDEDKGEYEVLEGGVLTILPPLKLSAT